MEVDYTIAAAYGIGILFLFILGRIFLMPMKVVLKLIYNALIGGIILIAVNYIGGFLGFHLPFNIITAFIVGLLGVPGILLLVLLKFIFGM